MSLSMYTKSKYPPRRHKIVESTNGILNLGSLPSIPLNWNIVRCTLHSIRRNTILPSLVLSNPLPTGLNYTERRSTEVYCCGIADKRGQKEEKQRHTK